MIQRLGTTTNVVIPSCLLVQVTNPHHPSTAQDHHDVLSLRNRPPRRRAPLPGIQALLLQLHGLGPFLDDFLAFRQDEFDVAGVGHVWVDLFDII